MEGFAGIAVQAKRGLIMDMPTSRASARRAAKLGIALGALHRQAICKLTELRARLETDQSPFFGE